MPTPLIAGNWKMNGLGTETDALIGALLGLGNERRMAELARRAAENGLSVRAVEEMVRNSRESKAKETPSERPASTTPHVRRLETELQRHFGTAAKIHVGKGDRGRIEIPFYGSEDFERVMELLLGAEPSRL